MSFTGGTLRRACATTGGQMLRRQYHRIVVNVMNVGPSSSCTTTQQQPHFFHHQQLRHFAKGDEAQALKKQSPSAKKKQAAASNTGPSDEVSADNKTYKMVLEALDAPITKPPPASKEEMERRHQVGKDYVIGKFNRKNEFEHDLSCKIRLKNHAIKMLPKNSLIRTAAMEVDDEGPPIWRHIPVWTPPIAGFNPEEFMDQGDKDGKGA